MATPTSAWASAGASFVPSPVIATKLPPPVPADESILSSGVASARKSSTPARRRSPRGQRVVAHDHDGRMPICRSSSETIAQCPSLTMTQVHDAEDTAPLSASFTATKRGVPPATAIRSAIPSASSATVPPRSRPGGDRTGRALADLAPVDVHTRHQDTLEPLEQVEEETPTAEKARTPRRYAGQRISVSGSAPMPL